MKDNEKAIESALAYVDSNVAAATADVSELVRIPSVSTDPAHKPDVQRAAEWVAGRFRRAGFGPVDVVPTAGHPLVIARWHPHEEGRTVLVYGHYDVQPPEPLDLWESPPFEPVVRDGKLYGRGASDDKGGLMTALLALEAAASTGTLPVNVTFVAEGEEEIGSDSLATYLSEHASELAADLIVSADGGIFGVGRPSVTMGSRGIVDIELTITGPSRDLHSGSFGGMVANPAMALAHVLSSMQAPDGVVKVAGFYDGVREITEEASAAVEALPAPDAELEPLGLTEWWGDPAFTVAERRYLRPTLEINGLTSGYQGPGGKTIIPSVASAKLTCRLAPGQEPANVVERIREHVAAHTPPGVTADLKEYPGSARAYELPAGEPALAAARQALRETFGVEPITAWEGGTIPIADTMSRALGAPFLFFAFGEPDNQVHAPNEFYRLSMLEQGAKATVRLLFALAD